MSLILVTLIMLFSLLVVTTILYPIKRFRRWAAPGSRRERDLAIHLEAWHAADGLVAGAAAASIVFPTSNLIASFVYLFWVDERHASPAINIVTHVATGILIVGALFLVFAIFWGLGIALLLPVWEFIYRCGARGPIAAAALGAIASATITFSLPLVKFLAFGLPSEQIAVLYIVIAGAIGGAMVWWSAYRPEVVRARLRRCPVLSAVS